MGSLSSDVNQQGDGFSATLEQPIVVDGWVVARRGQIAIGRVVDVQKAGRVKGVSSMALALSDLPVVDGQQLAVQSQLVQTSAGPSKGRDAAAVASTTGLGAGIGGAVDGGAGAGIGAAAGAAAGIAGVLLTPGRPTVMPPETLLTFRLQEPVAVNTQRSQIAFLPVNQQDYAAPGRSSSNGRLFRRIRRGRRTRIPMPLGPTGAAVGDFILRCRLSAITAVVMDGDAVAMVGATVDTGTEAEPLGGSSLRRVPCSYVPPVTIFSTIRSIVSMAFLFDRLWLLHRMENATRSPLAVVA